MLESRNQYSLEKGDTEEYMLSRERKNYYEEKISEFNPDLLIFDFTRNFKVSQNSMTPQSSFDLNISAFPQNSAVLQKSMDSGVIELSGTFFSDLDRFEKISLILLFQCDPGAETKARCAKNSVDYLIFPFSFEEIDLKITRILAQRELKQRVAWQDRRMSHAVEHIDKLKVKLQAVEKRFVHEKELLHNSLKQINEMSREREHLKKELREIRRSLFLNVSGLESFLSSMIDSKSEHRRGHSRRVGEIALFVADKIGLEDASRRDLKKAAMLHEIGMLLIPDRVLDKELKSLSRYERDMLDLHFSKGAQYLEKCPGFEKTAGVIRHVNENSDGTGFPDKLKRRYIPLLSRVLAGADVLDQLWIEHFNCPDAADFPVEYLLTKLEDHAGARIDPAIVNYLEKYVVTVLGQDRIKLKEIGIAELKPGMVIGTGLFTRTGTKLFTPGTCLTKESIDMMIKYNREYPVDETVYIKVG